MKKKHLGFFSKSSSVQSPSLHSPAQKPISEQIQFRTKPISEQVGGTDEQEEVLVTDWDREEACSRMESGGSNSTVVAARQRMPIEGIRLENPFAFKALQVFTGFGIGCGVGIGVGHPINLSAIPMVGELMSATRGATNAFSGVTRHVNNGLLKLGAKNIQAGIGCGVGFGHGIGVGLAVKPSAVHKLQARLVEAMTKSMMKVGIAPNLSLDEGAYPIVAQSNMSMVTPSIQDPIGSIMQMATKPQHQSSQDLHGYGNTDSRLDHKNQTSKSNLNDTSFGSRTESVINSFLQNPILKDDEVPGVTGRLRSENKILQMVLKHQQIIEELMDDNVKLRRILVEELKISPSKLQKGNSSGDKSPCSECFECRRKHRKSR